MRDDFLRALFRFDVVDFLVDFDLRLEDNFLVDFLTERLRLLLRDFPRLFDDDFRLLFVELRDDLLDRADLTLVTLKAAPFCALLVCSISFRSYFIFLLSSLDSIFSASSSAIY